jgi:hypothetical protein
MYRVHTAAPSPPASVNYLPSAADFSSGSKKFAPWQLIAIAPGLLVRSLSEDLQERVHGAGPAHYL